MDEKLTSQLKKLSKGEYGECIVEDLITQQTINVSLEDFEAIEEFMGWMQDSKFSRKEKNDIVLQAVKHFGDIPQILQTFEEIGEVQQAINKAWKDRSEENVNHLATELAQVVLMLNQICDIFGVPHRQFMIAYDGELRRLKERLDKERKITQ